MLLTIAKSVISGEVVEGLLLGQDEAIEAFTLHEIKKALLAVFELFSRKVKGLAERLWRLLFDRLD